MSFNLRFANEDDAKPFAEWAAKHPDIPKKDIRASLTKNNPTSKVLVVEVDGKAILYVPVYCALRIAFLGFNPEITDEKVRVGSMNAMLLFIKAFAHEHGINEIDTLTLERYPVARWAKKHKFNVEDRQLFTAYVNKPKDSEDV